MGLPPGGIGPLQLAIHLTQNRCAGEQKSQVLGQDKQRKLQFKIMYVFFLTCPCATFAHQHGGFVSREWLAAKGLLDERTRKITTFVTHRGLYRYKRLMFGVTSAPEKYQKIVADVLHGCEGVANLADDLIEHGCGIKEHDRSMIIQKAWLLKPK